VETAALREAKTDRSAGEYCWTLTPFVPQVVMEMCPDARRVTYLDADLFFFDSPHTLLEEFEASGKDVLITDHAYAPEYEFGHRFGRFCVQFMTFRNTKAGRLVLHWWQDRCVEWCYAREEDGKFGDQKYLDDWPERFRDAVHVLKQTEKTLAPWNIAHVGRELGRAKPVFFHFQSLRLYKPHRLRLFSEFRIGARNMWIYQVYVPIFRRALASMRAAGIEPRPTPVTFGRFYWLLMMLQGRLRFASV